jgi:hypothetical protein
MPSEYALLSRLTRKPPSQLGVELPHQLQINQQCSAGFAIT